MPQNDFFRIIRLFAGLTAYSLGITLTIQADIGLAPWDVFHHGVALWTGITFGMASIAVSAVIVAVSYLFRERFGIGTILNVFYIGIVIDALMLSGLITKARSLAGGIFMMAEGLFVIAFATFLYMGSGYGAGPRDSLMVVLSKRTGKAVGLCRGAVELTALIAGWALGGRIGVGTIVSAFGIGAAVQIVFALTRFDVKAIEHEPAGKTLARAMVFLRPQKPRERK